MKRVLLLRQDKARAHKSVLTMASTWLATHNAPKLFTTTRKRKIRSYDDLSFVAELFPVLRNKAFITKGIPGAAPELEKAHEHQRGEERMSISW